MRVSESIKIVWVFGVRPFSVSLSSTDLFTSAPAESACAATSSGVRGERCQEYKGSQSTYISLRFKVFGNQPVRFPSEELLGKHRMMSLSTDEKRGHTGGLCYLRLAKVLD